MATKIDKTAKAETKNYEVLGNLQHDGEPYAKGDTVALTEAQAAPLLGEVVQLAAEAPAQ